MKQNYLILLLAAAALWSCDDDTATPEQPQTTESKPMSFTVTAKSYEVPSGIGTRSSAVSDLDEDSENLLSMMFGSGLLMSCYDMQGTAVFSNYIYRVGEAGGVFTDINGEEVDTPMWPGSDTVAFYAYYNGGGDYYYDYDGEIYDYTIQKNDAGHWCVGMKNSDMAGGSDLLACKVIASSSNGDTVRLNLQHILTKFRVVAQRAATTDSINVSSFSVYFPDTVVYDFDDGKIKRIEGVTDLDYREATAESPTSDLGYNYFQAYYATMSESGATAISKYYQDSVVLTETASGDDYWYFAVPDSLMFDFGYSLYDSSTSKFGEEKTVSATVNPSAGQKIIYNVTLPGQSSTTIDEGTVGTGAN